MDKRMEKSQNKTEETIQTLWNILTDEFQVTNEKKERLERNINEKIEDESTKIDELMCKTINNEQKLMEWGKSN